MPFIPDEDEMVATPGFVPDKEESVIVPPKTLGGFISNIGRNAMEMGKGLYDVVRHPVATKEGIEKLATGAVSHILPENILTEEEKSYKEAVGKIGGTIKEKIKHPIDTLYEHPLDALSMVSLGAGMGAKAAQAGRLAKTAGVLSKVSKISDPTNLATVPIKATRYGVTHAPWIKGLPRDLYASSLKPKTDTLKETLEITDKYLDKGYVVSIGSWQDIQNKITGLQGQIKTILRNGTIQGEKVDIKDIVSKLDELKADRSFQKWRPDLFEKNIERTKKKLIEYHETRSGGKLTPEEVQKIKLEQYRDLEKEWGQLSIVAKDEMQKAIAMGSKESLENLFPELKELNLKSGELLEFNKHIEKALKSNLTSDEVRNLAFIIKAIFDNPTAKSQLAIWLNKAKKSQPLVNPKAVEKNLILQSGKISYPQEEMGLSDISE